MTEAEQPIVMATRSYLLRQAGQEAPAPGERAACCHGRRPMDRHQRSALHCGQLHGVPGQAVLWLAAKMAPWGAPRGVNLDEIGAVKVGDP